MCVSCSPYVMVGGRLICVSLLIGFPKDDPEDAAARCASASSSVGGSLGGGPRPFPFADISLVPCESFS